MDDLNYYNSIYLKSEKYRQTPEKSIYYELWNKIISIIGEESIIEIGCGSGQLANLLIKNNKNYLYGFDYSIEAIKLANGLNPNNEKKFILQNMFEVDNKLNSNIVLCIEVLEHLDDDYYVFKLLNKKTRFIFSVPDFYSKTHKRLYDNVEMIENRFKEQIKIKYSNKFIINKNKNIYLIDSIIT